MSQAAGTIPMRVHAQPMQAGMVTACGIQAARIATRRCAGTIRQTLLAWPNQDAAGIPMVVTAIRKMDVGTILIM